jgi:hypothetical protein
MVVHPARSARAETHLPELTHIVIGFWISFCLEPYAAV